MRTAEKEGKEDEKMVNCRTRKLRFRQILKGGEGGRRWEREGGLNGAKELLPHMRIPYLNAEIEKEGIWNRSFPQS